VLAPLRDALAGAPGPRLADIGGGTGNYALALKASGYEPVVIDRSAEMLAHAAAKGLETVTADAQRLPFQAASFDAAMLVSMLHHVERRSQALSEARRVLRARGRLAVMLFTREDIADAWCLDYFPSSRPWMNETHPPLDEVLSELPGARRIAGSSRTSGTPPSPQCWATPACYSTPAGALRRAISSAWSETTPTSSPQDSRA
jgi:ubiquinone/menaquinone biosynthesis C-methylase UbiE